MFTVRENRMGDMGGSRKDAKKTINDNKAGFKEKDDGNTKYGKEGKKKDAEQPRRKAYKN